ncbi:hypothetical protein LSTR_LSTR005164 [Laodelphax striatellus]|uniref:BTB domain-containing protein n=1 Tax=Laodelphax striatellus TaxID=195883 RepID=A0A482WZA3_LAOST|nr:hypothetical protein LSTR_LSTR005164 [Laodelphax striatellus]
MAAQQFCLRWNNHQPNFISVFSNLLSSESLVDVTLAAEGKHVQAHKVVLSACSSYFQSLFTVNPCQHPIVILKDIKYSDLKTMIDFMYYGEVNVSQEQLPAILKTAETLKVKGLAEMPDQNIQCVATENKSSTESHSPSMLRRKRLRKSSTGSGSGSTEQTTAGSEEMGGSGVASSSPLTVKAEALSEGESSLRHEPSTDSEHGLPSQDSVEDMNEQSANQSSHQSASQPQSSGHHPPPQNQSSTSSDDKSDNTLGRSSSTEDNSSPSASSQTHFSTGDQPSGVTMGSKRGRLLLRQNRIKRDCELMQGASEPPEVAAGDTSDAPLAAPSGAVTGTISLVPVPRLMERQCSEPAPQTTSPQPQPSPNLLSVPQPPFLIKQHSSPQLQIVSSTPLHLQVVTPHSPSSQSESALVRPKEELRRTASSPQAIKVNELLRKTPIDYEEYCIFYWVDSRYHLKTRYNTEIGLALGTGYLVLRRSMRPCCVDRVSSSSCIREPGPAAAPDSDTNATTWTLPTWSYTGKTNATIAGSI